MEELVLAVMGELNRIHQKVLEIERPFLDDQVRVLAEFISRAPADTSGFPSLVNLRRRRNRLVGVSYRPLPQVELKE
jgi:hypothetical protein